MPFYRTPPLTRLAETYVSIMPRTCSLALQGHAEAIRSLELVALADSVQPIAEASCLRLFGRGVSWRAIATTMAICRNAAKSDRARAILGRASIYAERKAVS
jgi:hypothetical protein